jgi:hypothetical protein
MPAIAKVNAASLNLIPTLEDGCSSTRQWKQETSLNGSVIYATISKLV